LVLSFASDQSHQSMDVVVGCGGSQGVGSNLGRGVCFFFWSGRGGCGKCILFGRS